MLNIQNFFTDRAFTRFKPKIKIVSLDEHSQKIVYGIKGLTFYKVSAHNANGKNIFRYFPCDLLPQRKEMYKKMLLKEVFCEKISIVFTGLQKEKLIFNKISSKPKQQIDHLPLTRINRIKVSPPLRKRYDYAVVSSKNVIQTYNDLDLIQTDKWIAVGLKTAKLLEKRLDLSQVDSPDEFGAIPAADLIIGKKKNGRNVVWLGARGGVIQGIDKLKKNGFKVEIINPYESLPLSMDEIYSFGEKRIKTDKLLLKEAIWIFTSPSAASNYLKLRLHRENHFISCIGLRAASVFFEKKLIPYHIASKSALQTICRELNIAQ